MTQIETITKKINQLTKLLETANDNKILWEEMKIVSAKAFDLQDEICSSLTELEETETELIKLQSIFDTREIVWDIIAKIASREMEIKEKTTKGHKNAIEKIPTKKTKCECQQHSHHHKCCHSDEHAHQDDHVCCGKQHPSECADHHHEHKKCKCNHKK